MRTTVSSVLFTTMVLFTGLFTTMVLFTGLFTTMVLFTRFVYHHGVVY